jgi:hypothetical protein
MKQPLLILLLAGEVRWDFKEILRRVLKPAQGSAGGR